MPTSTIPSKRAHPLGLWKARANAPRFGIHDRKQEKQRSFTTVHESSFADADDEHDDFDDSDDASSSSSKRRRFSSHESDDLDYWDYARKCSTPPPDDDSYPIRTIIMDITSTASQGAQAATSGSCDYEDWEDLKELFAKATESYEADDVTEAFPLLRGVIHECHRFLLFYQDPSVVFTNRPAQHTQSSITHADKNERDWSGSSRSSSSEPRRRHHENPDLPTAFYTILGSTLFFFGNLMAQDSSFALAGEPTGPYPYWLTALDVFEIAESLPSRTDSSNIFAKEDWRMAIIWGRTLICLADESISRYLKTKAEFGSSALPAQFADDDPQWPPNSPFAAITARRPLATRRLSLRSASPHELMMIAMDHFSRGIFHMPHSRPGGASAASHGESFSRAKELFTVASEVLGVAERLEAPDERQQWAAWADSVLSQMKMEANMDAWRGPITRARGRCWLVVGSARVDEFEAAMEKGDMGVLQSEAAQEAREGLSEAITFFERAKTYAADADVGAEDLQPLLTEALLTLANLTADEHTREALYARAQLEGGDFDLDAHGEPMDQTE